MRKVNTPKPARPQMEVYSSGHATGWMHDALPSPLTSLYSLIMAGSISGLAYFAGDKWSGNGMLWATVAIGAMTLIGLVWMGFSAKRAKKKTQEQEAGFESALRGSASGWDGSVSDPAEIARLDDLRGNFFKGIQAFHEYGKDLYSLPWYVIVGEPGSGKTEAIRRSELRFPDALQDKLQGTGGTYSMHWWFTNQAVIIDTAGAMLMQAEASLRFEEFLKLLSSHRPACPINGMILTIPSDSLLSDPPAVAEQKARTIATQLAMIQKALNVRFPIYLMVSKSDRLPGFREFFDMEGQAKFERQMLGWSNPAQLGEAFSSETVYEAIDAISRRLQSRALSLLADPISPNTGTRRADEVDSLYAFPQLMRGLAPRLKLYLDVIFQTGTWVSKPPFFRGIFFTTALREGAQLDIELAKSLGMPLNQLPPGGIFAREKSAFLRDLFLEKIFQEKGLVTRLFDVGAHLRKRLTTFYGVTALLLCMSLGFAWLVKDSIETQLAKDQSMWAAANVTWQNGTFLRIISRSAAHSDEFPDRPRWNLSDNSVSIKGTGNRTDPVVVLEEIRDRAFGKVSLAWVFYPVSEWRDFLERRELGYLTLFEGSVMKPVLDATRERILWDIGTANTTTPETQQRLAAAYQKLLQLEIWLASDKDNPSEADWEQWFLDLLSYITDPSVPGGIPSNFPAKAVIRSSSSAHEVPTLTRLSKKLAALTKGIYGTKVSLAKRHWMSELSEDKGDERLRSLSEGSRMLLGISGAVEQNKELEAQNLEELAAAAKAFLTTEGELDRIQTEKQDVPLTRINELLTDLKKHATKIGNAKPLGGYSQAATQFQKYLKEVERLSGELENKDPFFSKLRSQVEELFSGKSHDASPQLSPELTEYVMKENSYLKRLTFYDEALKGNGQQVADQQVSKGNLIGRLNSLLIVGSPPVVITPLGSDVVTTKPSLYEGPRAEVLERICHQLIPSYKDSLIIERKLQGYLNAVSVELLELLRFPLVSEMDNPFSPSELDKFKAKCQLLAKIAQDIEIFDEKKNDLKPGEARNKLIRLFELMRSVIAVSRSLYDDHLKDLRKITVAPSKPQEFKEEPPQMAPQQPALLPGQPANIAPPPAPKIIPGFNQLIIETSDGDFITQTPSNVVPKEVPCTVGIKVNFTYTSTFGSPQPFSDDTYGGHWGILKAIKIMKKPVIRYGGNKLSISFDCRPALPSSWPSRVEILKEFNQGPKQFLAQPITQP